MRCARLAISLFVFLLLPVGCLPQNDKPGQGAGGAAGQSSGSGGQAGSNGTGGKPGTGGSADGTGGSGSGGSSSTEHSDAASDVAQSGSGGGGGAQGGSSGSPASGGATGGAGSTGSGSGGKIGGAGGGGVQGSGGMPGTGGGIPGMGGNAAPTACSFPSSWTQGSATYTTYTLPNAITACGYNGNNNTIKNIVTPANFAAIPGTSSSDFNTSNRCGACIQIGNAIVTVVDECPYDGSNNPPCKANPTGHMDLSNAAASAGGVKGDPNVHGQAQWKYIPCPVTGNVIVRLKTGNSNEMFIENIVLPIASVTCGGQTGSRTSYGAWHFAGNIPGATCDITDIAGRKITVAAGSTQGQDVDTKVQFPKCQ